jgi:hypothetical protein
VNKLLIIQKDDPYFLYETLQVLEKNINFFRDYELSLLVNEESLKIVSETTLPLIKGITTSDKVIESQSFDVSVNLSLKEETWDFHSRIKSEKRLGFYRMNNDLRCDDLWSSYLLTIKARCSFLTFHLQDIYKNILGIKSFEPRHNKHYSAKTFVYGTSSLRLISAGEQENFLIKIAGHFRDIPVKDITEIDLVEDVTNFLYIGPATLSSLRLANAGARCIFITSAFQGFNLLPSEGDHILASSRGSLINSDQLFQLVDLVYRDKSLSDLPLSIYKFDNTFSQTSYLSCLNDSDDLYPFYQSHVILWSFLLNLSDIDLNSIKCSNGQLKLLLENSEILTKFIRLHDYAMVSVNIIQNEAKSENANAALIEGHIKNLKEVEKISDQIAASHPLVRPFLDFYRIRRGQNSGSTLAEQAQHSFLTYAEEHHALKALAELFSVTLRRNEVNI